MQFLLWNKYSILLFLVILLAFFLRFYRLTDHPSGFHIDEATMGWNSYLIMNTGKDETGRFFPLYSKSFGLDRAMGNFLLTGFSVSVFGLKEFAVRMPFALFGLLTVILLYFLSNELFENRKISLISTLLLSISPLHLNIVRASSEASVSLFLVLLGQILFFRGVKKQNIFIVIFALISLGLSVFFYHSSPLLVVFSLVMFCVYFTKSIPSGRSFLCFSIVAILLLVLSTVWYVFASGGGINRFSQVGFHRDPVMTNEQQKMFYEEGTNNVINARVFHNKIITYLRAFIRNYSEYFSLNYLFLNGGFPLRYSPPATGILYLFELPLLFIGTYSMIKYRSPKTSFILGLLFLSPVVAALTYEQAPNVQRAFFIVPYIELVTGYGLYAIYKLFREKRIYLSVSGMIFSACIIYYLHQYYIHYPVHNPLFRNDGVSHLAKELIKLKDQFQYIIVTSHPEPSYHYFFFYSRYDAFKFQKLYANKLQGDQELLIDDVLFFTRDECPSQKKYSNINNYENVLIVDSSECHLTELDKEKFDLTGEIKRKDGSIIYRMLKPKNRSLDK